MSAIVNPHKHQIIRIDSYSVINSNERNHCHRIVSSCMVLWLHGAQKIVDTYHTMGCVYVMTAVRIDFNELATEGLVFTFSKKKYRLVPVGVKSN